MPALEGKCVLIVVENLSAPFDRRVWQESRSLANHGCNVIIVCPKGHDYDTAPYELVDGIHIFRYDLTPAGGGAGGYAREYATALLQIRRLIRHISRRWTIDIVHACNPPDLLLLAAVSVRRAHGAALVFDHHDLVPELCVSRFGSQRRLLYRGSLMAEALTFRLADVVISTNESYRRVALGRGGKSPADVFVVRSAPDATRFGRVEPNPSLRGDREHLIAYLGVMGPQDGVDHALLALHRLRQSRRDWRGVFIGSGDVACDMQRLARRLELDDAVEFTGRIPDAELATVLSTATVGLCPDPPTPLNLVSTMNKTLEYMAMGLPVVAYDLPETRYSAGPAAVYAQEPDPTSFAAAIGEVLDAPDHRQQMGAAGMQRIAGDLSWQVSEKHLIHAYERAVQHASQRRRLTARCILRHHRLDPEPAL